MRVTNLHRHIWDQRPRSLVLRRNQIHDENQFPFDSSLCIHHSAFQRSLPSSAGEFPQKISL